MSELVARFKLLRRNPRPKTLRLPTGDEILLDEQDADGIRVLCGFVARASGVSCSGLIGYAHLEGAERPHPRTAPAMNKGELPNLGDWFLHHPERYRVDEEGVYHVLTTTRRDRTGRKVGRRPLPEGVALPAPHLGNGPLYGVSGRTPILPARVKCPDCGRINLVPEPDPIALGFRSDWLPVEEILRLRDLSRKRRQEAE